MNDELRERISRVDPMHAGVPTMSVSDPSARQIVEKIMQTQTNEQTVRGHEPRRTWTMAVAALAALVIGITGVMSLGSSGSPPIELSAGQGDALTSCIMFTPAELARVAELAFEGTVTSVGGETVTLTVDRWFAGGESAQVVLNAPSGLEALIGGIPFEAGQQYLISAQGGTVNYCGFSGVSTPEYRASFEQAFGA